MGLQNLCREGPNSHFQKLEVNRSTTTIYTKSPHKLSGTEPTTKKVDKKKEIWKAQSVCRFVYDHRVKLLLSLANQELRTLHRDQWTLTISVPFRFDISKLVLLEVANKLFEWRKIHYCKRQTYKPPFSVRHPYLLNYVSLLHYHCIITLL